MMIVGVVRIHQTLSKKKKRRGDHVPLLAAFLLTTSSSPPPPTDRPTLLGNTLDDSVLLLSLEEDVLPRVVD